MSLSKLSIFFTALFAKTLPPSYLCLQCLCLQWHSKLSKWYQSSKLSCGIKVFFVSNAQKETLIPLELIDWASWDKFENALSNILVIGKIYIQWDICHVISTTSSIAIWERKMHVNSISRHCWCSILFSLFYILFIFCLFSFSFYILEYKSPSSYIVRILVSRLFSMMELTHM